MSVTDTVARPPQRGGAPAPASGRGSVPATPVLSVGFGPLDPPDEFDDAHRGMVAALDAARAQGDKLAIWNGLRALAQLWTPREHERAGQFRKDGLAMARAIGDQALVARSLNLLGTWYVSREDPQSGLPHHLEAQLIHHRLGDAAGTADTLDLLQLAHRIAGDMGAAAAICERAIAVRAQLHDEQGLVHAMLSLVECGPNLQSSVGAPCTTASACEPQRGAEALAIAQRIGWRAGEARAHHVLADALAWRGEYAEALRLATASLDIARDLDDSVLQCTALRTLGSILLELDVTHDATACLLSAHEIARALVSATLTRRTGAPLAVAFARAGQVTDAIAVLDIVDHSVRRPHGNTAFAGDTAATRELALARAECALVKGDHAGVLALLPVDLFGAVPRAQLLRAQAHLGRGDASAAVAALDAADDVARRQGGAPLRWRVEALRDVVAVRTQQDRHAHAAAGEARTVQAALPAVVDAMALTQALLAGMDLRMMVERATPVVPDLGALTVPATTREVATPRSLRKKRGNRKKSRRRR